MDDKDKQLLAKIKTKIEAQEVEGKEATAKINQISKAKAIYKYVNNQIKNK